MSPRYPRSCRVAVRQSRGRYRLPRSPRPAGAQHPRGDSRRARPARPCGADAHACAPRNRARGQTIGPDSPSHEPHCRRRGAGRAASSACHPRRLPHDWQPTLTNMMAAHPWQRHSMTSPRPQQDPDLGAWIIVGLCFLALAVSFSARSSLSLIMDPMEKELGWSRSTTSAAASLAQIFMAAAAPIVGNLVDRFGARFLLSFGLAAVGGGVVLAAGAHTPWQFYGAYSIIAGIGFGTAATHVVSTIVSLNFTLRRGLAVGIATAGATGGQLVVIPILARVLDHTDWRTSYVAIGTIALALAPVVFLLIRPRATDIAARQERRAESEPMSERLRFLLGSPTFHLLFWSYFICGITTSGVIEAHLIPYSVFCGFPVATSSDAFGLLMAFNLGGMVLAGWLSDRMNRPLLLGAIYILRGITFILLMFITG